MFKLNKKKYDFLKKQKKKTNNNNNNNTRTKSNAGIKKIKIKKNKCFII